MEGIVPENFFLFYLAECESVEKFSASVISVSQLHIIRLPRILCFLSIFLAFVNLEHLIKAIQVGFGEGSLKLLPRYVYLNYSQRKLL